MKTISQLEIADRVCLVRADLNVPLDPATGAIIEQQRLTTILPTIRMLQAGRAKVVLMSHLGRPESADDMRYSMAPVREALSELLGEPVIDAAGPLSERTSAVVGELGAGQVAMLENLRFLPGEAQNSDEVARELASLGEVYVNDAFAVAHRSHASVVGIPRYLPSAIGPLFEREVETIALAVENPRKPSVAILGGAKVADKFPLLRNIAKSYDRIIVGGGVAAVFLALRGYPTGGFKITKDEKRLAQQLLDDGEAQIETPSDLVITEKFSSEAPHQTVPLDQLGGRDVIMDIGGETAARYAAIIRAAKAVIWNGPVGVYEWEQYRRGSDAIGRAVASLTDATTVAGGGSTVSIIKTLGLTDADITHVSTGGGAFLKMLAGEALPAYEALERGVEH